MEGQSFDELGMTNEEVKKEEERVKNMEEGIMSDEDAQDFLENESTILELAKMMNMKYEIDDETHKQIYEIFTKNYKMDKDFVESYIGSVRLMGNISKAIADKSDEIEREQNEEECNIPDIMKILYMTISTLQELSNEEYADKWGDFIIWLANIKKEDFSISDVINFRDEKNMKYREQAEEFSKMVNFIIDWKQQDG
jgi:hypothetical protein